MTTSNSEVIPSLPAVPPVADDQSGNSATSWEELASMSDLDDEDATFTTEPAGGTPEVPAEPVAVVEPQPVATPPTPAVAQPTPAVVTPPVDAEAVRRAEEEQRTNARVAYLAEVEKRYGITSEQASQIAVSPETALPKLLAQAHANAVEESMRLFQTMLPQMMEQTQPVLNNKADAWKKFQTDWPEFTTDDQLAVVAKHVTAYRRDHPQATAEEVSQRGGLMAAVELGMDLSKKFGSPPATTETPARPMPPAAPGGATSLTPGKSDNQFVQLAEELLNDDE